MKIQPDPFQNFPTQFLPLKNTSAGLKSLDLWNVSQND